MIRSKIKSMCKLTIKDSSDTDLCIYKKTETISQNSTIVESLQKNTENNFKIMQIILYLPLGGGVTIKSLNNSEEITKKIKVRKKRERMVLRHE